MQGDFLMNKSIPLRAAPDAIGQFCQRRRIRRLTRLNEPVRPGSAAAFLVEFLPADLPPLATLAEMESEIATILGQPADLHLHIRGFCTGDIPPHGKIAYDRAHYMEFDIPQDQIAKLCAQYGVKRLATIQHPRRGSIINDSDLDFIAESDPYTGAGSGVDWFRLSAELNQLLGYPVDIREVDSIAAWQQETVRKGRANQAAVLYERPH